MKLAPVNNSCVSALYPFLQKDISSDRKMIGCCINHTFANKISVILGRIEQYFDSAIDKDYIYNKCLESIKEFDDLLQDFKPGNEVTFFKSRTSSREINFDIIVTPNTPPIDYAKEFEVVSSRQNHRILDKKFLEEEVDFTHIYKSISVPLQALKDLLLVCKDSKDISRDQVLAKASDLWKNISDVTQELGYGTKKSNYNFN